MQSVRCTETVRNERRWECQHTAHIVTSCVENVTKVEIK